MRTPFFNQHRGVAESPPYQPPKPRQWPAWALPLKLFAQSGDRGLGDIVARKIGLARGAAFKAWFKEKFNRDCGCSDRQIWLNQMFPLSA
jgi:hypothetical protein